MKRSHFICVLVVALAAGFAGCQRPADEAKAPAQGTSGQPTAEESFETVVDTFRRGVEDIAIGFRVPDGSGGQTLMTGRNEVSHKLIPPAKPGDPYKAEITVTSQSEYSLQRSKAPSVQAESNQTADSGDDAQIYDPAVASAPDAGNEATTTADKNAVTVARTDNTYQRTYELIYENGRWKLLTKLDPKSEELIKFAFDRALGSQS
jgi:hypothetical protein